MTANVFNKDSKVWAVVVAQWQTGRLESKNRRGRGFHSRRVLGFNLNLSLSSVPLIRSDPDRCNTSDFHKKTDAQLHSLARSRLNMRRLSKKRFQGKKPCRQKIDPANMSLFSILQPPSVPSTKALSCIDFIHPRYQCPGDLEVSASQLTRCYADLLPGLCILQVYARMAQLTAPSCLSF